jgi:hypothetical protein
VLTVPAEKIHPRERFTLAVDGGADLICAAMFDVRGTEAAFIAKKVLSGSLSK